MTVRVLYVGDTQTETIIASKGFDTFTHTYYKDSARILRDEVLGNRPGVELTHLPADRIRQYFPYTVEELNKYDVVILSDVGYNNFSFLPGSRETLSRQVPMGPDRIGAFIEWVNNGGGVVMAGGWLSFSGLEGKGNWGGSRLEAILPVTCHRGIDDRIETGHGAHLNVRQPDHPIVRNVAFEPDRMILGYNQFFPKEGSETVITVDDDAFLTCMQIGKGRSVAYATDPAFHWCGDLYLWDGYGAMWESIVRWAANKPA